MLTDQHEMRSLTELAVKLHRTACASGESEVATVSANDLRRATCALLLALGIRLAGVLSYLPPHGVNTLSEAERQQERARCAPQVVCRNGRYFALT